MSYYVYDPSQNAPVSSDLNTLRNVEYSQIFAQKVSAGDRSISGVQASKLASNSIVITNPNGVPIFSVNTTEVNISPPITTPAGQNLVINPGGPAIDFTGHTLINIGGIAENPAYFPVVGDTIQTTNTVPQLGDVIPADPDSTYTLDSSIALVTVAPSITEGLTGSIFIQSRAKRIGGILTVTSLTNIRKDIDPAISGCTAYFGDNPPVPTPPQSTTVITGPNYDIHVKVIGVVGYNIKWKVATTITKQTFV